ncbi:unnamed protein product [Microthlaspi erraticum]|uniref:Uncharacterized protein n=1 Tax=Microthlaspi erraticum TaxID=1685480 RepID=A0A6D2ITC2_9BRAS|nr:unnamed protein product [Microthlaspi erraticum]
MDKMIPSHHSKEAPCPRASQSLFSRTQSSGVSLTVCPLQTTTLPPSSLGGTEAKFGGANSSSIELGVKNQKSGLLEHSGAYGTRSMEDLAHGRSSTGYAKEEGGSHLEDQLDPSSSTRPAKLQLDRAEKSKSNPKNVASPLTFL